MSTLVPLNVRLAEDAQHFTEIQVALVIVRHPSLEFPVRLSSDNTVRLSNDPLEYGTYSTWLTDDGRPFKFILMSALVPDEKDAAPSSATIVIENVDESLVDILTSIARRDVTIDMAVVEASAPNLPLARWTGMKLLAPEGDALTISFEIAADPILDEAYPVDLITHLNFPALFAS